MVRLCTRPCLEALARSWLAEPELNFFAGRNRRQRARREGVTETFGHLHCKSDLTKREQGPLVQTHPHVVYPASVIPVAL